MHDRHSAFPDAPAYTQAQVEDRGQKPRPSDMSIGFHDVHFGYDGGHTVLKGISFDIPAGKMIALTGHLGAGKRSCARLLTRLWDVSGGRVRIGGTDVRDLPLKTLRELVAYVPREGSFATLPEANDAERREAARIAEIDDLDALPETLSPGERQRLALAAAILSQAPILILDEPASRLSAADELAWRRAVANVRRGRTVLLIAHRLATLRMADAIVVIERGEVVEEGKHEHLLAWNDRYTALIANQTILN